MLIPSLGYVLPVEKRSKISSCFQGLVGRTLVKLLLLPAVQRPIFRITYFSRIGSFEHAAKRSELDTKSCPGPRAAHSCVLAALAVESFVLACERVWFIQTYSDDICNILQYGAALPKLVLVEVISLMVVSILDRATQH